MTSATPAVKTVSSEPTCEPTQLKSQESSGESSERFTWNGAQPNGSDVIEFGQRRREAYDAGVKRGAASFFQSQMMENLSLEVTLLRAINEATAHALKQCQWERDFWQAKFVDCVRVIGKPK